MRETFAAIRQFSIRHQSLWRLVASRERAFLPVTLRLPNPLGGSPVVAVIAGCLSGGPGRSGYNPRP